MGAARQRIIPLAMPAQRSGEIIQEWIDRHSAEGRRHLRRPARWHNTGWRHTCANGRYWTGSETDLVSGCDSGLHKDQNLIQDGSSANAWQNKGILPMFGFPTRVRLLYHKKPSRWPPHTRGPTVTLSSR